MRVLTLRGYLAVALIGLLVAVGGLVVGTARAQEAVVQHATGTFEVSVTPAEPEVKAAGLGLARYSLAKTFVGGMRGSSVGQMLAGGPSDAVGTYVALERFVGAVDGREGAFLLAHRGDMTEAGYTLAISVVPNSGTGALEGISGDFALVIEGGEHRYDLRYTLPER